MLPVLPHPTLLFCPSNIYLSTPLVNQYSLLLCSHQFLGMRRSSQQLRVHTTSCLHHESIQAKEASTSRILPCSNQEALCIKQQKYHTVVLSSRHRHTLMRSQNTCGFLSFTPAYAGPSIKFPDWTMKSFLEFHHKPTKSPGSYVRV